MDLPDGSFDVVLDKACIDALCTSTETAPLAKKALEEEYRVLKPSGWIVLISFAGPSIYDLLFDCLKWKSKESGAYLVTLSRFLSRLVANVGNIQCDFMILVHLKLEWGQYYVYKLQKPET